MLLSKELTFLPSTRCSGVTRSVAGEAGVCRGKAEPSAQPRCSPARTQLHRGCPISSTLLPFRRYLDSNLWSNWNCATCGTEMISSPRPSLLGAETEVLPKGHR